VNDPEKVEEFVKTMKGSERSVLDQILAWAKAHELDKQWLSHVINQDNICGCQFDIDGFNQYCEAWSSELARKEHMAELKIRAAGL
jgi:hypothetical protein